MTDRRPGLIPYAETPLRAGAQAVADVCMVGWLLLWFVVGRAVRSAILAFAAVGRQVESGAGGIAGNLNAAGSKASQIPLVGDGVSNPLRAAGAAAQNLAGAGHGLDDRASRLALLLALAVAVPPALAVLVPWLVLRLRFARRAATTVALARTEHGERLLALRALAGQPLTQLLRAADDPVQGWRQDDPEVIRRLAALELRGAGVRPPRTPGSRGPRGQTNRTAV